jgi:hypothetical protein
MGDENNGAEVTLELDPSAAFQTLCEAFLKLRTLYETLAVSQDRTQGELLANRALVKKVLEHSQLQDDRIAALVKLVDSHQATFESLTPKTGRPQ